MERPLTARGFRPPPPSAAPLVVWPRAGQPVSAVVIDTAIHGLMAHWTGRPGRTVPCWQDPCTLCAHGERRHWIGFAAAIYSPTGRSCVLLLTAYAARQMYTFIDLHDGLVRGLDVELIRASMAPNSPVTAACQGYIDDECLPPNFDFSERLEHLWGLHRKCWQVPAPLPPADDDDPEDIPC